MHTVQQFVSYHTNCRFYLFVATLIDFILAKRSLILKQKINWENIHSVTIIIFRYNDQLNLKQQFKLHKSQWQSVIQTFTNKPILQGTILNNWIF